MFPRGSQVANAAALLTDREAGPIVAPSMLRRLRWISPRLYQSSLATAGLLLCCVGLANWSVGRAKLSEYEGVAQRTMTRAARDPVELRDGFTFTSVSETQERHNIARAKLQYYSVVHTVGRLLLVVGILLVSVGYLRGSGLPRAERQNRTLLDSM
jgi:hypothetical protein